MYRLYIGNKNYSSWSLRPWLLMTEIGIPFEERLVPFVDGGSWRKFREFSPTGLVPCLHDGERVVWESLGIVEYLAERHAGVWPRDDDARAWARCASAEMHGGFSTIRNLCSMTVGLRIRLHQHPESLERDLVRKMEHLESWTIPRGLDYAAIENITMEAREKLARIQPDTLGQASRVSGVSPADISVLMVLLKRGSRGRALKPVSA